MTQELVDFVEGGQRCVNAGGVAGEVTTRLLSEPGLARGSRAVPSLPSQGCERLREPAQSVPKASQVGYRARGGWSGRWDKVPRVRPEASFRRKKTG